MKEYPLSVRPVVSSRVPSTSSSSCVRPSVPSSVPSSSSVLCPSVRLSSVRPSTSVRRRRPSSVRPSRRPSSSSSSVVVFRPLSVRPVVRLNITCKTSRSIRRKVMERPALEKELSGDIAAGGYRSSGR